MRRALALALAIAAAPAAGAVFRETSVEEAARTSDAVVRGRVERRAPRLTPDGRRIVTDVEIAVASAWKGATGERVVVTVPGGELDGEGEWVDAAPTFTEGEEVVVFLARRGAGFRVNGLALGKYRVVGGRAVPGLEAIAWAPGRVGPGEAKIAAMDVAELERRVRAAR